MQLEHTSSEVTGMSELEKALEKERVKSEDLRSKLSKLSVRNVNKRIKCREVKIAASRCQVKQLENETNEKDKIISELEGKLRVTRTSAQSVRQKLCHSMERTEAKEDTIQELSSELDRVSFLLDLVS